MTNNDNGGGVTATNKARMQVKDIIDTIYELTKESPYNGSFHTKGGRFSHVATILKNRGCIIRSGDKFHPVFSWNPNAMAPTKTFYESVLKDVVTEERQSSMRSQEKKNSLRMTPEDTEPEKITPRFSITEFSAQELWDEIKRRGYTIENNRLVRKDYLK